MSIILYSRETWELTNFVAHVQSLGHQAVGFMVILAMLFLGVVLGMRWEYMRKIDGR